jgi:GalNAc5-diNAcBac-PP-undecaprenol beta-1,3-glucosyltransferase
MTDATILIPTFRHARLLPYAIASALDQRDVTIEVLVLGDGVEDATREVLARFGEDSRVRFFDLPKGPRNGEVNRHRLLLEEAAGRIVTYLSDDDLLLPEHAADMARLLETANFAHSPQTDIHPDGTLEFFPFNYGRSDNVDIARGSPGSIGLTGVAHTLEAYRRLPHGWRTTPRGLPTDHYMWLQWLELPDFRGAVGERLTHLSFPDPLWKSLADSAREKALGEWFRRSRTPGFRDELDEMFAASVRRAAEDFHVSVRKTKLAEQALRATRTWRLREWLLRPARLRALLARRRSHQL